MARKRSAAQKLKKKLKRKAKRASKVQILETYNPRTGRSNKTGRRAIGANGGRVKIRGRGDYRAYVDEGGNGFQRAMRRVMPRNTFREIGSAAGGFLGPIGSVAGRKLGDWLAHITGFGKYKVSKNTLMTTNGMPPSFSIGDDGSLRYRYQEFIGDITVNANGSFKNTLFNFNPGLFTALDGTQTMLSSLANNFSIWKVHGAIIMIKSKAKDPVGNTALVPSGVIMVAMNYNSIEAPYTSKVDMERVQYFVESTPGKSFIAPIECDPAVVPVKEFYIRNGPVPSGDIRNNDLCTVQVASQGCAPANDTDPVAEMWISYDFEFHKPKPNALKVPIVSSWQSQTFSSATVNPLAGIAPDPNFVGDTTIVQPLSSAGLTTGAFSVSKPGNYLILADHLGQLTSGSFTGPFTATFGSNWGPISFLNTNGNSSAGVFSPSAGSLIAWLYQLFAPLDPTIANNTVTFHIPTGTYVTDPAAANAKVKFWFIELPPSIASFGLGRLLIDSDIQAYIEKLVSTKLRALKIDVEQDTPTDFIRLASPVGFTSPREAHEAKVQSISERRGGFIERK